MTFYACTGEAMLPDPASTVSCLPSLSYMLQVPGEGHQRTYLGRAWELERKGGEPDRKITPLRDLPQQQSRRMSSSGICEADAGVVRKAISLVCRVQMHTDPLHSEL